MRKCGGIGDSTRRKASEESDVVVWHHYLCMDVVQGCCKLHAIMGLMALCSVRFVVCRE